MESIIKKHQSLEYLNVNANVANTDYHYEYENFL